MGIAASCNCFVPSLPSMVKLVFWGGATQLLPGTRLAGEVLFKYPDRILCHADSFYIGRPIPMLSIDDKLVSGETYFVLPVDCFPGASTGNLTTAALASLSSSKQKPALTGSGQVPFEYVKSSDGRMLIKVMPEFIVQVISAVDQSDEGICGGSSLCSTPELRKHYAQLVGSRERPWSPKLETITEKKPRSSPVRLLGL